METLKPTPKVQAAGVAGAATTLIVFVASEFGLDIPSGAAAAITTLLAFGAGFLKRG